MNPSPASLSDRVQSLRLPDRPAAQPVGRWWLPWLLCLVFLGTTVFFALGAAPWAARPAETTEEIDLKQLAGAARGDTSRGGQDVSSGPTQDVGAGEILLESKGYIVPVQLIQVSPKVAGMVMKLNIREGQNVTRGEVLAELETIEYRADYLRSRAGADNAWQRWLELASGFRPEEIAQAQAEYDENKAQQEQLLNNLKRDMSLRSGQALAQGEYEQSLTSYRTMERKVERLRLGLELMKAGPRIERVDAAWADVMQAEAELTKSQWRYDNCTVRAPITGTILSKKAEEGNIVNPAAFNISASLCEMADLADMEVDLAIAERDIGKIFQYQVCKIRAEAFPNRTYEGWVSRLMPTADRAKGAVPVRAKIVIPREEAGQYLRPEMGALVTFLNSRVEPEQMAQQQ